MLMMETTSYTRWCPYKWAWKKKMFFIFRSHITKTCVIRGVFKIIFPSMTSQRAKSKLEYRTRKPAWSRLSSIGLDLGLSSLSKCNLKTVRDDIAWKFAKKIFHFFFIWCLHYDAKLLLLLYPQDGFRLHLIPWLPFLFFPNSITTGSLIF